MKKIFKFLTIFTTVWLLQGCCWTDHSEIIKEVAVPMQKELEKFYTENKHFPTTQERDEMLERVGCRVDVSGNTCVYERERMSIYLQKQNFRYAMNIGLENTGCFFSIQDDGDNTKVTCSNASCIHISQ